METEWGNKCMEICYTDREELSCLFLSIQFLLGLP